MSEPGMTHIAGQPVKLQGRYLRQRCSWCGAILIDVDLQNLGVHIPGEAIGIEEPEAFVYPVWNPGELVTLDGTASYTLGNVSELPDNCCAVLSPEVTT